jgi:hypothetical protein
VSVQRRAMCGTPGVRFPVGARDIFFSTVSKPALRPTEPPIPWVPGVLSTGTKWQKGEASADVKDGGAIPPLPHPSSLRDAGTTLFLLTRLDRNILYRAYPMYLHIHSSYHKPEVNVTRTYTVDVTLHAVNPPYNGPGRNGQNLGVCNCELLEMLRH